MREQIKKIFDTNKKLLELIDKAVYYFRECEYEKALFCVSETVEPVNFTADAVGSDREYFRSISVDSVSEMLKEILKAKKERDYILLADLYEVKLNGFICAVQELIISREQYLAFDDGVYASNIMRLISRIGKSIAARDDLTADEKERFRVNIEAALQEPLEPETLLKAGYALEFTSNGMMTMAAPFGDGKIYLHTNGRIENESFILANHWIDNRADRYIMYGFGMGYHAEQLRILDRGRKLTVFESDLNVLKLYCAFGEKCDLLWDDDTDIVYDPDMSAVQSLIDECRITEMNGGAKLLQAPDGSRIKVCIHYPSYRRSSGCVGLDVFVPWKEKIEEC